MQSSRIICYRLLRGKRCTMIWMTTAFQGPFREEWPWPSRRRRPSPWTLLKSDSLSSLLTPVPKYSVSPISILSSNILWVPVHAANKQGSMYVKQWLAGANSGLFICHSDVFSVAAEWSFVLWEQINECECADQRHVWQRSGPVLEQLCERNCCTTRGCGGQPWPSSRNCGAYTGACAKGAAIPLYQVRNTHKKASHPLWILFRCKHYNSSEVSHMFVRCNW